MTGSAHGTIGRYTNGACRCEKCRAAMREYMRGWVAGNKDRLADGDPRHGLYSTYVNYRCRCERCRAARHAYYAVNR